MGNNKTVKVGLLQKIGMMVVAKIMHEIYCDHAREHSDVMVKDWCGTNNGVKGAFRLLFKFEPGEECMDCKKGAKSC